MKEIKYKGKLEELYKENEKAEQIDEDEDLEEEEFTNVDEEIFEVETKQDEVFKKEDFYKSRRIRVR
jgi:hypothetical protein